MDTITVQRIHDGSSSHIEPPLDSTWDDLAKLRWHAAVVELDTGITPTVFETDGSYCVALGGGSSIAPLDLYDAWSYLNGVRAGVAAARRQAG